MFDDLFKITVRQWDNDPVIDTICNDLFDSIKDWYAEKEYESSRQLIYRPPPLDDVWLDEHVCRERKTELGKKRDHQEQLILEKKKMVSYQDIIPLNRKDDLPPGGAPISDDEMSDDGYFSGSPHTESEGYFFDGVAPAAPSMPLPPEASNIDP